MNLKFLSINIAGVQFDWFENRRMSLINQIKALSPDFVFLQETTIVPDKNYDQSEDIAKNIGLENIAFAPYGNVKEYESPLLGGIGILSRIPFKHVEVRKLPTGKVDKYGARSALKAKVSIDGKDLVLATTHLSWRPQEENLRVSQMEEFLKLISFSDELTVFGGDFNADPLEKALKKVTSQYKDIYHQHHPSDIGATWWQDNSFITSTWRGSERIDYLFCSHEIKTTNAQVVLNQKTPVYPSDHFGVLGEVSF